MVADGGLYGGIVSECGMVSKGGDGVTQEKGETRQKTSNAKYMLQVAKEIALM